MKKDDYYIVSSGILPDYYGKVIEARELLRTGEVKEVSEAAKRCGISRSTYYKYKDHVFRLKADTQSRRVVVSLLLNHEPGVLGRVLSLIGEEGANIVTINQNPPIAARVSVIVSLDISSLKTDLDTLMQKLDALPGVDNPTVIDMA